MGQDFTTGQIDSCAAHFRKGIGQIHYLAAGNRSRPVQGAAIEPAMTAEQIALVGNHQGYGLRRMQINGFDLSADIPVESHLVCSI
jgi:hypothetical protein